MRTERNYVVDATKTAMPLASAVLLVPPSAREAYFLALKEFAGKNGFEFRSARLHPLKDMYSADLMGGSIWISSWNALNPHEFTVRLYPAPGVAVTQEAVSELVLRLAKQIDSISGFGVQAALKVR